MTRSLLVTGGAGFIGSNFVQRWIGGGKGKIVNLDKLTYAGSLENLASLAGRDDHVFVRGDICERGLVEALLREHRPRAIVHFAAETHVDRSIAAPEAFLKTNVEGTFSMLTAALAHYATLAGKERDGFLFLHISTDEVYGSLLPEEAAFREDSPYAPNSPYAASKAASDHLVRAWHKTYGLPTIVTHSSNNYGPFQFPEKLIPVAIAHALAGEPIPVYGDGRQVRDWLHVADHCGALERVLAAGRIGETYNIGGGNQPDNLTVVSMICDLLDELAPASPHIPHGRLIRFVDDRPGHDRRYAMDTRKIERELGWRAEESFAGGLRKTVAWYLANTHRLAAGGGRTA